MKIDVFNEIAEMYGFVCEKVEPGKGGFFIQEGGIERFFENFDFESCFEVASDIPKIFFPQDFKYCFSKNNIDESKINQFRALAA